MDAPLELEVTLANPAVATGLEPESEVFARVRIKPKQEFAARPKLELCFLLDASASMHRFVLDPEQRAYWQQRAEQRGEVTRQLADGRTGMVWKGQTLRAIGEAAGVELERILERRVHLFLFVKVRGNWLDDPERYREMGLDFER